MHVLITQGKAFLQPRSAARNQQSPAMFHLRTDASAEPTERWLIGQGDC